MVAVDGSKQSKLVVDSACKLAKKTSSKLILMYVPPFEDVPEDYARYAKQENIDMSSYYEGIANAVLSKFSSQIESTGLQFESLYEFGNAANEILKVAKSRGADFIVVGLHGLHGIGRIRSLGSVARRVIENAECDVIVVPTFPKE